MCHRFKRNDMDINNKQQTKWKMEINNLTLTQMREKTKKNKSTCKPKCDYLSILHPKKASDKIATLELSFVIFCHIIEL